MAYMRRRNIVSEPLFQVLVESRIFPAGFECKKLVWVVRILFGKDYRGDLTNRRKLRGRESNLVSGSRQVSGQMNRIDCYGCLCADWNPLADWLALRGHEWHKASFNSPGTVEIKIRAILINKIAYIQGDTRFILISTVVRSL